MERTNNFSKASGHCGGMHTGKPHCFSSKEKDGSCGSINEGRVYQMTKKFNFPGTLSMADLSPRR